jgi:hypothetical protein
MEALHFGEENDHPHKPLTLVVHRDIRKVSKLLPLEMVHIPTKVPFEH